MLVTDDGLNGWIKYSTTDGKRYKTKLKDILTHVTFHGMQHRAEIAAILTEFGHSPGNIDYIVYLRESGLSLKD